MKPKKNSYPAVNIGSSFMLVILIILYYLITERTSFGRHVYAVGGNKAAAELVKGE